MLGHEQAAQAALEDEGTHGGAVHGADGGAKGDSALRGAAHGLVGDHAPPLQTARVREVRDERVAGVGPQVVAHCGEDERGRGEAGRKGGNAC